MSDYSKIHAADQARRDAAHAEGEREALQEQIVDLKSNALKLSAEIATKDTHIAQLIKTVDRFTASDERHRDEADEARKLAQTVSDELAVMGRAAEANYDYCKSLLVHIDDLRDNARVTADRYETKIATLQGMLAAENEGRLVDQQALAASQKLLQQAQADLFERDDTIGDLTRQIETLKGEAERDSTYLAQFTQEKIAQARIIKDLEQEVARLKGCDERNLASISAHSQLNAEQQRMLAERDKQINERQATINALTSEVREANDVVVQLRVKIRRQECDIAKMKQQHAKDAEEHDRVRGIIGVMAKEAEDCDAELEKLRVDIAAKDRVIGARDAELKELRELRRLDLARLETCRRDISSAAARERAWLAAKGEIESKIWDLQTLSERLEKDNQRYIEANAELAIQARMVVTETERKNELDKIYGRLNAIENKLEGM